MMHAVQISTLEHPSHQTHAKATRLVVIDTRAAVLTPVGSVLEGLDRNVVVRSLDASNDGIQAITEALRFRPLITQLDVIVFAQLDGFYLGSTKLTQDSLDPYSWDLQGWFEGRRACKTRPQIQIHYGECIDASLGADFLASLNQLTGADVRVNGLKETL